MLLRGLAEPKWFANNRELYFDTHRALYTDRLAPQQVRDLLWTFGKASMNTVLGFVIYHMIAMTCAVGFFYTFSYMLVDKPPPAWPICYTLIILVGLYGLIAAYAGVFMVVVAWVVSVGVRRSRK